MRRLFALLVALLFGMSLFVSAQDTIDEPLRGCTEAEAYEALDMWFNSDFNNDFSDAVDGLRNMADGSTAASIRRQLKAWLEIYAYYITEIEPNFAECHAVQAFNLSATQFMSNSVIGLSGGLMSVVDDDGSWLDAVNPLVDLQSGYGDAFQVQLFALFAAANIELDD